MGSATVATLIKRSLAAKNCAVREETKEAEDIVKAVKKEAAKKNPALKQVKKDTQQVLDLYERLPLEGQVNRGGPGFAMTQACPESAEQVIFPGARTVFEEFFDQQGINYFKQATAETVQNLKDRVATIEKGPGAQYTETPPPGTLIEVPLSDAGLGDGNRKVAVFAFSSKRGDVNAEAQFYIRTSAARLGVRMFAGPFPVAAPPNIYQAMAAEKMEKGPKQKLDIFPNVIGAPHFLLRDSGTDNQRTVYLIPELAADGHETGERRMVVQVVGLGGHLLAEWWDVGRAPNVPLQP